MAILFVIAFAALLVVVCAPVRSQREIEERRKARRERKEARSTSVLDVTPKGD